MKTVTDFQKSLAEKYKYKKLHDHLQGRVRQVYIDHLPQGLVITGDDEITLFSLSGIPISKGYDRIVIGDYGAFIEISPDKAYLDNFKIQPGQEYRQTDKYKDNVKYDWYTTKNEDIKIYFQKKTVMYADYLPNKIYVCPYEIKLL